jgi:hypothetical protein
MITDLSESQNRIDTLDEIDLRKNPTRKDAYIDLIDTLIHWDDELTDEGNIKEIFCGTSPSGESFIRFASPTKEINEILYILGNLRKEYDLKLLANCPRIYACALNEEFNLGFNKKDIITMEEYMNYEGYPEQIPQAKRKEDTQLISASQPNSKKSHDQRTYLRISPENQINIETLTSKAKNIDPTTHVKKKTQDNDEIFMGSMDI